VTRGARSVPYRRRGNPITASASPFPSRSTTLPPARLEVRWVPRRTRRRTRQSDDVGRRGHSTKRTRPAAALCAGFREVTAASLVLHAATGMLLVEAAYRQASSWQSEEGEPCFTFSDSCGSCCLPRCWWAGTSTWFGFATTASCGRHGHFQGRACVSRDAGGGTPRFMGRNVNQPWQRRHGRPVVRPYAGRCGGG
jgi:hypothetical protein